MTAHLPIPIRPKTLALSVFIALYPLAQFNAFANTEHSCTVGSDGQWLCVAQDKQRVAPRPETPVSATAAVSSPAVRGSQPPSSTVADTTASGTGTGTGTQQFYQPPQPYAYLDWVPREQLTEAQLAEIAPYCSGRFVEPARIGKDDTTPFDQSPVYASSEHSLYDQVEQTTVMTGNVVLRQSSLQFDSDRAELNQLTGLAQLDGNIHLRDRDLLIAGEHAELHLASGEVKIEQAEYVLHEMQSRGGAEYIKREEDGIIRLKSGSYTSCAPGNSDWHLQSNNITLNQETGFGHATNVTLRVKNVPVFYTPYIYFPIDDRRQTGFLPPSAGYSNSKGISLATPYYINLAPHLDATLYPHYMSKRGLLAEGEFRYLTEKSSGQVGGAWLGSDQEKKRKLQTGYKQDRWLFNAQHQHGFNTRLLANVDYTDVSDPYYFQDLSSNIVESSDTTLDQRAGLTWRGDSFTAGLNLHAYERVNISDITPYDKLPELTLNGSYPGDLGPVQLSYATELTRFDRSLKKGKYTDRDGEEFVWRDAKLRGLDRATGTRAHIEPAVSLPLDWAWGYIKPSLKYTYTRYDLELDRRGKDTLGRSFNKSPSRNLPIYSVDSGLYFDRKGPLFGKNYTQTLEPRLFYLYVPYEDQSDLPLFDSSESSFSYSSLFRDNRFTGRDRIGDTNQISLGLTYRWLEESGVERQRVSIGQAYYLSDRKVLLSSSDKHEYKQYDSNTTSRSPYATQYMYRFNQDWQVNADWAWDPGTHSTRTGSVMFNYQPEDNLNKIVNLGYRYRNDGVYFDEDQGRWVSGSTDYIDTETGKVYKEYYKIEQTDASIMWPIFSRWNAIARWQYDYNHSRTLEAFGGFEYNSCCWKVRLINRYWVHYDEQNLSPENNRRPDRGVFLQVVLKGLGGITGNKVGTFLDEGIPGYKRREDSHAY